MKVMMCRMVAMLFLATATCVSSATPTYAPGKTAYEFSSDVPREWMQLNIELAQQSPGESPPSVSRKLAYVAVALYEAVVPGMPKHRTLAGQLNELSSLPWAQPDEELHWPTVANAAMATMTRMLYENASAENKAKIDALESGMALRRPKDFDQTKLSKEIRFRSQTFGQLMAMAIMTWARTDEAQDQYGKKKKTRPVYAAPTGAGLWSPTPPTYSRALLPYWGNNRTFVLKSASDCQAPEPPIYSEEPSSAFYRDAKAMYEAALNPTIEQRQIALYWADESAKTPTPSGHWEVIATDLLKEEGASLARAAEVYVQLNLAMADSFIAGWNAKYKYNGIRPVTYVQMTMDSKWTPRVLATPPFPEYPSGHSFQSAAAALVLQKFYGSDRAFIDNAHNDRGWGPRKFSSFAAAADEAAESRITAGIHFRFGVEGGKLLGRCVGDRALGLKFQRQEQPM